MSALARIAATAGGSARASAGRDELWVRSDLAPLFAGLALEDFLRLGGELVRTGPDGARATSRLERGGRRYFLKVHTGVGWREIAKCWLQGKPAVVDARPEAEALARLAELDIPAPRLAAFGARGRNPARRRSFVLTEALEGTEDLAVELSNAPAPAARARQDLARRLGRLVGRLHGARIAHRDLYLTHFRIRRASDGSPELFLIDLHRAHVPRGGFARPRLKDLAGLRFSTLALQVTRGDCARFWRAYTAELAAPFAPSASRRLRRRIESRARAVRARIARRGGDS